MPPPAAPAAPRPASGAIGGIPGSGGRPGGRPPAPPPPPARAPGAGGRGAPVGQLLQVLAGLEVPRVDLQDALEGGARAGRVAGLQPRRAVVQRLLHLAVALGLHPPRRLDALRRLLVVDV